MRKSSIVTATVLILATLVFPANQAQAVACTAASTCSTFTSNPGGSWSSSCSGCESWGSGNTDSTFNCPSSGTCVYHNNDPHLRSNSGYSGCLTAERSQEVSCRASSIDISQCATCDLVNDDGYLVCDTLNIQVDVTVSVSGSGTTNAPYSATWSYAVDFSNSSPNSNNQYVQVNANSTTATYELKIKNKRKANIYYNFTLPSGWSLKSTPAFVRASNSVRGASPPASPPAWPSWLSSCRVSSTMAKVVENGSSNQSKGFRFQIQKTSTTLTSPDPTVITKSNPNT